MKRWAVGKVTVMVLPTGTFKKGCIGRVCAGKPKTSGRVTWACKGGACVMPAIWLRGVVMSRTLPGPTVTHNPTTPTAASSIRVGGSHFHKICAGILGKR